MNKIPTLTLLIVLMSIFAATQLRVAAEDAPTFVKITARRFNFSPNEVTVKKGKPVVFQLTTEDRTHGFYIPMVNLRTDVVPGKISELKWTPKTAGDFDFACDIFCGSGHESMDGKIKVVE
jgi:cytochrome c oxidase subunit 2